MPIAGIAEASAPTGEVVAALSVIGGWNPITAYSLRRDSGRLLSGRPPSEPFRSLKRATRFIISALVQVRMFFQSPLMLPPIGVRVISLTPILPTGRRASPAQACAP